MKAVDQVMSLKFQLAPNQELNLLELPNGISDFIQESGMMPQKQSTKSSLSFCRTANEDLTCIFLALNGSFSILFKTRVTCLSIATEQKILESPFCQT